MYLLSSRATTARQAATLCAIVLSLSALALPAQAQLLHVLPNVNTNGITQITDATSEPAVVINRANPNNIVVLSNDNDTASGLYTSFSTDGGLTWTARTIANGTDSLIEACCDPSLASDSFGNIFAGYENATVDGVAVAVSTNGGLTFSQAGSILPTPGGSADQPTFVVGPGATAGSENLWVSFFNDTSGGLTVAHASVTGLGAVGAFSAPVLINGPGGVALGAANFGDISVGPNGNVAVSYQDSSSGEGPDTVFVAVSTDGGATFGNAVAVTDTNVGAFRTVPSQAERQIDAESALAWDHSGGAHDGRLYMMYTDAPTVGSPATQVFLRHSDDNGVTWSSPVAVGENTGHTQMLPRMSIDQTTGNLAFSWYDTRNDATDTHVQFFAAVSTDGGETFGPNTLVSAGISDQILFDTNTNQFGDYSALDYFNGVFYPTWMDNSNSTGDNPRGAGNALNVYTAHVSVAPEPGTLALLAPTALSLVGILIRRRQA